MTLTTIGIISGILLYFMVLKPLIKRKLDLQKKILTAIQKSFEEIKLMNSKKLPTDEHILLYYKMYLKKEKLDHDGLDIFSTDVPIPFKEWEKRAKSNIEEYGGYKFMIPKTMDMMIGIGPNASFHRMRNYEAMVLADEKEKENEKV